MKRVHKTSAALAAAFAIMNLSKPSPAAAPGWLWPVADRDPSLVSVMTYNVKGLPFPVATGRPKALAQIGRRLGALRRQGRQPDVVLLQEAFTPQAKAIARLAGYPYVVFGPSPDDASSKAAGRWVDSGLAILSDHPIRNVQRMTFAQDACAGFDCLAAKGVVLAWLDIPGRGRPLAIADTHMNARGASGVAVELADAAYARQAAAARRFIAAQLRPDTDVVFGGDFNLGTIPARIAALSDAGGIVAEAQEATASASCTPCEQTMQDDIAAIRKRAKDKQYFHAGAPGSLRLERLSVPFGSKDGADILSDHLGFVADYRLK